MSDEPTTKDIDPEAVSEPGESDSDSDSKIPNFNKDLLVGAAMSTESVPEIEKVQSYTGLSKGKAKVVRGVMKAIAHVTKKDLSDTIGGDGEPAAIVEAVTGIGEDIMERRDTQTPEEPTDE